MMKMVIGLVLLNFVFPALAFSQFVGPDDAYEQEFCWKKQLKILERKFGDYRVKVSYANDKTCQHLEIFKKRKKVFHETGFDLHYFLGAEDGKPPMTKLFGRGNQLVVRKWTGGMHCCYSLLIFDLGRKFKKIGEIVGGNYEPEIVDLNRDGIAEIRVFDDFLAYRFSSFAFSAIGEVMLQYSHGRYSVSSKWMKKPAPTFEKRSEILVRWRKLLLGPREYDWPSASLIQEMVDLIFSGHKKLAFDLLNQAWPSPIAGRDVFISEFRQALSESLYYPEFEQSTMH